MLEPPLTPDEARVLGCLVEKEATTPDAYPLTANSLRNACNQSTSRDPVMELTDHDVERALATLRERGLTRTVHSTSNRATKYRHAIPEAMELESDDMALLAVLLLRGAQTAGELKTRTSRLHGFESVGDVTTVLERLVQRELVTQLERRPGQKDARWIQLLTPADDDSSSSSRPSTQAPADHLTTVFDHGRLRIGLGVRSRDDDGDIDLRVDVRAEQLGGTLTDVLLSSDLERFATDLEDSPGAGRCRLGGDQAVLVELRSELENRIGPNLSVECSVVHTESDRQEWLQFVMPGVPPFAAETAVRVRAILAEAGEHAASDGPGDGLG